MSRSTRVRSHLRSNVIGYLALFFALTMGTAYATHPGGANTISTVDIINGEVKTADIGLQAVITSKIANDSVTGAKVVDESLGNLDIKAGAVRASEIAADAVRTDEILDGEVLSADIRDQTIGEFDIGADAIFDDEVATGGVNSRGIANDTVGAADLGTITQRSNNSAPIPAGGNGSVTATCNAGEQFLSGGNDGFFDVFVVASRQDGNGWAVFAHNDSTGNRTVTAHVYCLTPGV